MDVSQRIAALRRLLEERGLAAWVVPSADPHQSEYVAPRWRRRAFISGFDGSAGTVVVAARQAGLWTDSRYFLQAGQQLAGSGIELFKMGEEGVPDWPQWLAGQLDRGARVGMNPEVFSLGEWRRVETLLREAGLEVVAVFPDLVDQVWGDARPAAPAEPVRAQPLEFAGTSAAEKLAGLRESMEQHRAGATLVCALDEIAWLLNLRGADIAHNPVFLAYLLVEQQRATLFSAPERFPAAAREALPGEVELRPYQQVEAALEQLGSRGTGLWLDPASASQRMASLAEGAGAELIVAPSPVAAWKARKNDAEIAGMRRAHHLEGLVLARFGHWLDNSLARGQLDELAVVDKIESLRAENPDYLFPSFSTIAAWGPNGAIVHYEVDRASNRSFGADGLLLVDCGAQYPFGTTDVTRTYALAKPSQQQRHVYTQVLKAHLALSRAVFLRGADGYQLDVIARSVIWQAGMHYGHGTGHGVGAALCVHEGPFSVSARKVLEPLQAGNVLSIEPGIYLADRFGVRIENLAVVVERGENEFGSFLGFEPLTLCPYERRLIDTGLLTDEEIEQVDAYHRLVEERLAEDLEPEVAGWLRRACQPLSRED